jgi:hypothetical protein
MTDVIAAVLGTAAWLGGVFVLVVMALLPVLERFGTLERQK